jgi:hypothetical protein
MPEMPSVPSAPRIRFLLAALLVSACRRSSLIDLPRWRVEVEPNGQEARVVQLPYELTAYDMQSHAVVRKVLDRNHDGVSDRIVTYEGLGGARVEETDTNFDGSVDRWETFGALGQRLKSATARRRGRPDRVATYDRDGLLARVEIDSDLDSRFDLIRIYEAGKLVRAEIDSDGNGRTDRIQDFRQGYLSGEDFDTNEDGAADLRMTFSKEGGLLKVSILNPAKAAKGSPR